jgi:RNA polymerase sigma factor (sigma-70 family)
MTSESLTCVVRYIHQLAETPVERERGDAELLHAFVAERDEMAFRLLVHRHGRMVLNVCRRMLRQREDAEDAFQAVFLILAQSAAGIQKSASLASWLYGVAYRISLKARAQMSKRRRHEKQAAQARPVQGERDVAMRELQAVLTEEVARLSEKYRAPFVLCCLEGISRSEAAQQLGWKEGTLSGRIAEARKILQARLQRRGICLAAALCAVAVDASAEAAVPPLLFRTTIDAALGLAAGQTAASVASAPVAALMEGATRAMFFSKVKLAILVLTSAGLVAAAGSHLHRVWANPSAGESATLAGAPATEKPGGKKPAEAAKENGKIDLHGRVLDPDGKPLAGATLFFLPGANKGDSDKGSPGEMKSSAEGRFRFTLDRSHLVHGRWLAATAEGYAFDWIDADKLGAEEITLRLAKDMPITGRILTLEGRPVNGASIQVQEVEAPPGGDLTPVLKTIERNGNRVFPHSLRHCFVGTDSRFLPPVKADEQGRFRLTGLGKERIVRLWVEGPDIEHQMLYVLTRSELNVKELLKSAPDRVGGLMRLPAIYGPTFEHLAGPTRLISGIVRDRATGKPLADVPINGSIPNAWWENYVRTVTDKEGRYRLIGLPKARSYHVSVWGLKNDYIQVGKDVRGNEGLTPITQDFELVHGVRVCGRITDKTSGKPVPAALWYVPLEKNKYFAALPSKDASLWAGLGHRNEKDGSYSLLALPGPGIIKVRAEVEDNPYIEAALDPADRPKASSSDPEEGLGVTFLGVGGMYINLSGHNAYRLIDPATDASSLTCDFTFDRGRTLKGTVADPEGKPLTGVRVQGLVAIGGSKVLTGSSFQILSLNPAQPRTIAFGHTERKLVGFLRLGGKEKESLTVRLQPGAVLTGRLLNEEGKPMPGVAVSVGYRINEVRWLADAVAGDRTIQTGADGRFRIEGVFPDQRFGLGFRKGNNFLHTDEKYWDLAVGAGTKDLGDIRAKRPE